MAVAKRARTKLLRPEDLTVGTPVIYGDDKRGIVCDAFAALDQFWVRDPETSELVRSEEGEIVTFGVADLLLAPSVVPGARQQTSSQSARVLVLGTAQQMLRIIQHFGAPDLSERREPQMFLAVPCSNCLCGPKCGRFDASSAQTCQPETCPLLQLAGSGDGVEQGMWELAQSLRPDFADQINLRVYHLKQALEQLGPDILKLDGYYCLSSVTLPYGIHDIEAAAAEDQRELEDVRCHIDIGVTAEGRAIDGESSLDRTARRVLGEACGISLAEPLWEEDVQFKLRKLLGVDLPLKYWDGPEAKGYVLILPSDLEAAPQNGLLAFKEPKAGKTQSDWQQEQDQFQNLPKLPEDWIRIKSRSNGQMYYWNTKTQTSSFEIPLPEGWTMQKSKTSGKVYYFHAKKKQSRYDRPTEP